MPRLIKKFWPKSKKLLTNLPRLAKDSKRVALVITRLDRGGSAELTMQLAAGLSQNGYTVLLISGKTVEPFWDPVQYAHDNNFSLQYVNSLIRSLHPIRDIVALIQIVNIFRKFRPDILHTNSSKAGLLGRLAGHLCGIRKIYHSPHGHIFYGYYNRLISKTFILLEKLVARYTNKILNLTEAGRRDHITERIARPEKFIVSSCGVELEPFQKSPSGNILNPPEDSLSLIWVGRIVPIKNLQMLLDALVIVKQSNIKLHVNIVGDGELRQEAEDFVRKNNLEMVNFLGYRTDIPELLAKNDVFILTSINEGFGRVLVEAMVCGLAIIATRVGGVPEIIHHGENGLLIESRNHQQLAESILYLGQNRQKRQDIGIKNIKSAEFYSLNHYINRVLTIYNKY